MKPLSFMVKLLIGFPLLLCCHLAQADSLHVAVASNFHSVAIDLAMKFEESTGKKITLISGSTGKHYAQIRYGAPFDVFLAADSKRPKRLEEKGHAISGSRFTYAIGKVVLWSPDKTFVDNNGNVLMQEHFRYLAIANPKLAPYGRAAQEILQSRSLWHKLQKRIVRGENIAQAYQFVKSGNAELGFVAYSQVVQHTQPKSGSMWMVPTHLYTPVTQQAILLKESSTAHQFLSFLRSEVALTVIRNNGYDTP